MLIFIAQTPFLRVASVRLFTIVLLLSLLAGGLSFFQLDVEQFRCKIVAYEHTHSGKGLSTLRMPAEKWAQMHDHNEITVEGRQYDVHGAAVEGRTAILTVWADNDETAFVDAVRSLFEPETMVQGASSPLHFYKHKTAAAEPKIVTATGWLIFRDTYEHRQQPCIMEQMLLSQNCSHILTPPPEIA